MTLRLASRMLNDAVEAEDVTQEACLHAFLTLDRLRDTERFGAWLCGIVVNLCRMRLRARRNEYALEDWVGGHVVRDFTWADVQPSAEAVYEILELHRVILNAIELLPPEQQAVVRLHYFDGLTLNEIGVVAGAPLGTVKARLHRARERLRAELKTLFVPSRKESKSMIEVVVKDVIVRTGKPAEAKDVVEAASREQPGPQAENERQPLPPGRSPQHRVVLLQEKTGERIVPIWIGPHEADMLVLQLAGKSTPRPLTYDLIIRLLEAAHATIERIAVSRLYEEVFYATLWLRAGNTVQEVDGRPSDAISLALRVGAPIFIAPEVMDSQGVAPDKLDEKLAHDQSEPEEAGTWASLPVPDLSWPKK